MASRAVKTFVLLLSTTGGFALSACVSQGAYDKVQAQNEQLQQQNQQLQQQVAESSAHVSRLQSAIKYTVNSDLLFPSGSWKMSPRGQQIISRMASKLAPTQENKLYVYGYTDNQPIGAALQQQGITSNDQLSEKRAEAVANYLVSQGVNPQLVTAHGYGAANPVGSNATASGRAQNRRVELTLTPE